MAFNTQRSQLRKTAGFLFAMSVKQVLSVLDELADQVGSLSLYADEIAAAGQVGDIDLAGAVVCIPCRAGVQGAAVKVDHRNGDIAIKAAQTDGGDITDRIGINVDLRDSVVDS